MSNDEILKIEKKNPNQPQLAAQNLGVFPAAAFAQETLIKAIENLVGYELKDIKTLSPEMERNLREEFQKLLQESNVAAVHFSQLPNGKRVAQVIMVEV